MNPKPRILIVDDEPFNVDYLEQELADLDCELLTAMNGQQALEKIRSAHPDLVLLDIMMPIMDGFAVLEQVKAEPAIRNIPIIVISANSDLQSVVKGIQKGADDYLPKPFEPTILHARISASLDRKRLRDQEQLYLKSLENELNIARHIQQEFLPIEMPEVPGWEIAAYFKAAKFVAGDYYDSFLLPDGNLILVVGDVCGKGVGAALFMTLFRSLLRATSSAGYLSEETNAASYSPTERIGSAIGITNRYVASTHEQALVFSTVFIAVLDVTSGTLTYINAGNEAPVLIRAGGMLEELRPTGPVVGFMPDAKFFVKETVLEHGDGLLIFTDGIPDSKNSQDEFFGHERLKDFLDQGDAAPAERVKRLGSELDKFIDAADQFDDITILSVRRG
jgi:phosphoserine phosphatase RsbU/P